MNVIQSLIGLNQTELTEVRASCLACILAGNARGLSYTIAGRSFSFPSVEAARDTLQAANYALGLLTGERSECVRANFNPSLGRGR